MRLMSFGVCCIVSVQFSSLALLQSEANLSGKVVATPDLPDPELQGRPCLPRGEAGVSFGDWGDLQLHNPVSAAL